MSWCKSYVNYWTTIIHSLYSCYYYQ